jgi:hypothetical protein
MTKSFKSRAKADDFASRLEAQGVEVNCFEVQTDDGKLVYVVTY